MRTNGICMAENSHGNSLLRSKFSKAKRKFAPFLLVGGLILSNCVKGQELKADTVNIRRTEQTELTERAQMLKQVQLLREAQLPKEVLAAEQAQLTEQSRQADQAQLPDQGKTERDALLVVLSALLLSVVPACAMALFSGRKAGDSEVPYSDMDRMDYMNFY